MKFNELEYIRPNIDLICEQINLLKDKINNATDIKMIEEAVDEYFKLSSNFETMQVICSVRQSINTLDKFYEEEMEYLQENTPKVSEVVQKFNLTLLNHPLQALIKNKYGDYWFKKIEVSLKTFDPIIMEDLVTEAKLSQDYDKLIAQADIEFNGNHYNLSQMGKFAQDKDRNVRKQAAILVDSFFSKNSAAIDDIYDKLVKVRTTMAKKLGFDNYVELGYLRLGRVDYDKDMVANYRKQVLEDLVPVANELRARQFKRINVEQPEFYDCAFEFLDGNPTPKGTKDELVEHARNMYSKMSSETKEFFDFMLEHDLMDLETKKGKMGGGYCTFMPDYKAPFIFSNFNGTKGDVDVLTHEAGHAFQAYTTSRNMDNPDLVWATYETSEIHSMSMEFFAHPYLESFFKEDTRKYKISHMSDAITFIPYGVLVDHFQHYVYENPLATPKMRKDEWRRLEKMYLPYRKYSDLPCLESGGYWYRQGHIFGSPFYYIDYTLAQVCALEFHLANLKDHNEAWNRYLALCKLGGTDSFLHLIKQVGLLNPFVDGTIKTITNELIEVINELEVGVVSE